MIITISREFGSGGRELGKRLAEAMHIPCYDHQIIEMIAKENGLNADYVANVGEKCIEAAYPMTIGHRLAMMPVTVMDQPIRVAVAQRQLLEKFAQQGDCVIVGRCADYLLQNKADCLKVFIHADMTFRAKRIVEVYGEREQSPEQRLRDKDKRRAAYHRFYTDMKWGDARNYHIALDSGVLGIEKCADMIASLY